MDEIEWSEWVPFSEALASAPRAPGVYMAREGETGEIVYIGMAGERQGSGKPQGIRGRLAIYASGKGLASGLGEAVFDRALADPAWVKARMVGLEASGPLRAKQWGIEAFVRADLRIRWTTTADKASAAALEDLLVRAAGGTLWNKASTRLLAQATSGGSTRTSDPALASPDGNCATTQRVSANDLAAGQIRIPIAYKVMFPAARQQLTVTLRGEPVACGWNPQLSPGKQRSSLLRPPSEVLRRLVAPEELLVITIENGQLVVR